MSATPARRARAGPGSAGRPLRRDAERNRQRILDAASEVFAARGLDASLDDVAALAGVGIGTVYRRFANKDVLVEALFEHKIERIVGLAAEAAAMPDGWSGLAYYLEAAATLQAKDLGLRQVLFGGGYGHECVARARARLRPPLARLVDRAHAEGSLRADITYADIPIAMLMLSSVAAVTRAVNEQAWRRCLTVVLDGLRARPHTTPLSAPPVTLDELQEIMRIWVPTRRSAG
jgi:AcrR family transcriptional regulator